MGNCKRMLCIRRHQKEANSERKKNNNLRWYFFSVITGKQSVRTFVSPRTVQSLISRSRIYYYCSCCSFISKVSLLSNFVKIKSPSWLAHWTLIHRYWEQHLACVLWGEKSNKMWHYKLYKYDETRTPSLSSRHETQHIQSIIRTHAYEYNAYS